MIRLTNGGEKRLQPGCFFDPPMKIHPCSGRGRRPFTQTNIRQDRKYALAGKSAPPEKDSPPLEEPSGLILSEPQPDTAPAAAHSAPASEKSSIRELAALPLPSSSLKGPLLLQANRAGRPLAGARWELYRDGAPLKNLQTGEDGSLRLDRLEPGAYLLREIRAVPGYLLQKTPQMLMVPAPGGALLTVVSSPAPCQLSFTTVDAAGGWPLHRAVFRLEDASGVWEEVSGWDGRVCFGPLTPGDYRLCCRSPVPGYAETAEIWSVGVDSSGSVIVNGRPAEAFSVPLRPLLTDFTFQVSDALSGEPLAGAVFSLGDRPILDAVSDREGWVAFRGVYHGYHTLSQRQPAAGYQADNTRLPVNVSAGSGVQIDGLPAESYRFECLPEGI
ncbi:MAG: hypothetical protein HFJ80_08310 [Clostridiales bacterium]|nr:hypothetical protein [Clostridiales bacterium]